MKVAELKQVLSDMPEDKEIVIVKPAGGPYTEEFEVTSVWEDMFGNVRIQIGQSGQTQTA